MNPIFKESVIKREHGGNDNEVIWQAQDAMTIKGAVTKTCLLLLLLLAAAAYTWKIFYNSINPSSVTTWMFGGLIVGFILALIISFKAKTAPYLSPLYAVCEGLALGGISAIFNSTFVSSTDSLGIVTSAVLITVVTVFVMLFLYRSRIVKVNGKFRKILMIALTSILVFYIAGLIVRLIGGAHSAIYALFFGNSLLSIGINIVIVCVAALSLLQDFDFIEKAASQGAPKYLEWYGAFGLIVTLVWVYIEILNLLSRLRSR